MSEIQVLDKTFIPYIDEDKITHKVKELADKINTDYADKKPIFIGVLNGCFIFASDLYKNITISSEISFVKLASYKGTTSSGNVTTMIGMDINIKGRHVIIIEDIVDTGKTLHEFISLLQDDNPESVSVVALLDKAEAREHPVDIDYTGFEIQNKFVVGYGLDYDGYGRNTKSIYQLKS